VVVTGAATAETVAAAREWAMMVMVGWAAVTEGADLEMAGVGWEAAGAVAEAVAQSAWVMAARQAQVAVAMVAAVVAAAGALAGGPAAAAVAGRAAVQQLSALQAASCCGHISTWAMWLSAVIQGCSER